MPLHAKAKQYLENLRALNTPPKHTLPIAVARENAIAKAASIKTRTKVGSVEDRSIPGPGGKLALRIYTPEGVEPFPAIVYFHGGGWATNNLDTHDELCRQLCAAATAVVVSVDYRLAPESKFPAAVEDAAAATRWAFARTEELQIDAGRIVTAGDSSGGNLAAAVAVCFHEQGGPPLAGQVLYYPVTDHYEPGTRSYHETFRDGYGLTSADMSWFWDLYLPNKEAGRHPHASPLRAENLSGLPPALVITAENDPLVDEGRAYAQRLQSAGVPAQYSCYSGTVHGFLIIPDLSDDTARAVEETERWLRQLFAQAREE